MVYTGDTFGDEYKNKVFIADYTLGWIKELTQSTDMGLYILSGILVLGVVLVLATPARLVNK